MSASELTAQTLHWNRGVFCINALGGMIGPGAFVLEDGRQISPFHIAPWTVQKISAVGGGLLGGLRGEWPCVPFGYPMPNPDYPKRWQSVMNDGPVEHVHGFGSNNLWRFDAHSNGLEVLLAIGYPHDHYIKKLERIVRAVPDEAKLEFELLINVRRECRVPIALHGCFHLPLEPGQAILEPGRFSRGLTHPGTVEANAFLFDPDRAFTDLTSVPGRDGHQKNAAILPLDGHIEELLQLNGVDGTISLKNTKNKYRVVFSWDAEILPSVLLWYSNYGRKAPPWNGEHLCIGIEPCCSAFGFSPKTSAADNPIAQSGTPTAVALSPDCPLVIKYQIGVEAI